MEDLCVPAHLFFSFCRTVARSRRGVHASSRRLRKLSTGWQAASQRRDQPAQIARAPRALD